MRVNEVVTHEVECIGPDASIPEAAAKIKSLDIGPLPVCDHDRLVGMVADRDMAVRAAAQCWDPGSARVRDVMNRETIYVFEDQDVAEAARLMRKNHLRWLVVLNRDKKLVGIVSRNDLDVGPRDEELAGATWEAVCQSAESSR